MENKKCKDNKHPEEDKNGLTPEEEKRVDEVIAEYKKNGGVFLVATYGEGSKNADDCKNAIFMANGSGSFIAKTLCAAIYEVISKKPFAVKMALMEAIMMTALKD